MQKVESIIIGGGPCGLSAAIKQKREGISTLITEKGNVIESIYDYPTRQTFFSSSDELSIGDVPFIAEESKPRYNRALVYYREVIKYYRLEANAFEEVLTVKKTNNKFIITTTRDAYECRFLAVVTGYYGQHNTSKIKGVDLPKVFHYFKEAHPYFDQDVVIISGKNSAISTALELEKTGANVTVLYRGGDYSPSIRPWILPDFTTPVNHEKIDIEFNANVTQMTEDTVAYEVNGKNKTMHNDYVSAMIGYHPDYGFLRSISIQINTNEFGTAPVYNKETYETSIENCYITGVIAAGNNANTILIEDDKSHGGIITQSVPTKKQTPLES